MIGSVYDYYLTTYASKQPTKSDIHKKSELRSVYNNIVKISKKSPLYKINVSEELQKYAIDIKEHARSLCNDIDNLVFDPSSLNCTKYVSSNEDLLTVNTLNSGDILNNDSLQDEYAFEILHLAEPQVNTGIYLRDDSLNIPYGEHSFEVNINNNAYEFQFRVKDTDTNKSVLEKISRLMKQSRIGLNPNILQLGGNSALEISSESTGVEFASEIFTIKNSADNPDDDIVSTLGIDNVTSRPSNAEFILNGTKRISSSNTFTVNKSIEVTLNNTSSDGSSVSVTGRNDIDMVIDSVNRLVTGYNDLISLSRDKADDKGDAAKLNKEMIRAARQNRNELESVGLTLQEDGSLSFDDSIFIQSANEDSLTDTLDKLSNFKDSLLSKANDITINPMKYVNKIMISYPHPIKPFANPYVTSIYSGMMFNGYI